MNCRFTFSSSKKIELEVWEKAKDRTYVSAIEQAQGHRPALLAMFAQMQQQRPVAAGLRAQPVLPLRPAARRIGAAIVGSRVACRAAASDAPPMEVREDCRRQGRCAPALHA